MQVIQIIYFNFHSTKHPCNITLSLLLILATVRSFGGVLLLSDETGFVVRQSFVYVYIYIYVCVCVSYMKYEKGKLNGFVKSYVETAF